MDQAFVARDYGRGVDGPPPQHCGGDGLAQAMQRMTHIGVRWNKADMAFVMHDQAALEMAEQMNSHGWDAESIEAALRMLPILHHYAAKTHPLPPLLAQVFQRALS